MSLAKFALMAALPAAVMAGIPLPEDPCGPTTTTLEPIVIPTGHPAINAHPGPNKGSWKNEYEVVYETFCSTGLAPHTYTVTETCGGSAVCHGRPTGGPAPGFTTTVEVCSTCGPVPITATLTVPSGRPRSSGEASGSSPNWGSEHNKGNVTHHGGYVEAGGSKVSTLSTAFYGIALSALFALPLII